MKKLLPIAIASVLVLSACTNRQEAMASTDTPAPATMAPAMPAADAPTPASSMTPAPAFAQGDGFALGMLAAIDQHEIAMAQQAKAKNVTGDVLAYANMMEKDHSQNLDKTQSLGANMSGPDIDAMKAKGDADMQTLEAMTGADYSKAYMDAMVKGHTEALAAIDAKLMPAATRDEVKQHLTDTRGAVEQHLAKAQALANK